jgi:ribA/ribD-fused uncharacterized protein
MTPQARFIIRPEGEKSKCLIGINFAAVSTLKPGVIYEIVDVFGEYVIREVGAPAMPKEKWGYTINDIMESFEGTHLMTSEEFTKVQESKKERAVEKFTFFWSGPFSNWAPSPFTLDGVSYNCTEQHMMAEKARMFGDTKILDMIMNAVDPREQKRYGRNVQNFVKEKWDAVARDIVFKGCYAKFTQNPDLMRALLATAGTTLVEASPKDTIWGIGLEKTDHRAQNRSTWLGTNWLGEVLTKVREKIIEEKDQK